MSLPRNIIASTFRNSLCQISGASQSESFSQTAKAVSVRSVWHTRAAIRFVSATINGPPQSPWRISAIVAGRLNFLRSPLASLE